MLPFRFILKLEFCQVPVIFVRRIIWWKIAQFILPCCCPHEEPALPAPNEHALQHGATGAGHGQDPRVQQSGEEDLRGDDYVSQCEYQ